MQKRWAEIPLTTPELIPELQASLQINEVLARLLVLRGVHNYDEARDFFRPNIHHLHDPFLMQDMEQAIERIEKSLATMLIPYEITDVNLTPILEVYPYSPEEEQQKVQAGFRPLAEVMAEQNG